MIIDQPPIRPTVRYQQQDRDTTSTPPETASDRWCQPFLDVDPSEKVLRIEDPCLRLRHEEDACGRVKAKLIDSPTLTVVVKADLLPGQPASIGQPVRIALDQLRMISIQEPVQLTASPSDSQVDARVQLGEHTFDISD